MRKTRGFKLGKRLFGVTKWILRKSRIRTGYTMMGRASPARHSKPMSRLLNWGRRLTTGAKSMCCAKPGSGYIQLGHDPIENGHGHGQESVPKGHLAVYVGQKDSDFHRVMVPVIYFNHPLFSELLREAEEEFGFQHQGGITIPCRISEFERVQTRIASSSPRAKLAWTRHH